MKTEGVVPWHISIYCLLNFIQFILPKPDQRYIEEKGSTAHADQQQVSGRCTIAA